MIWMISGLHNPRWLSNILDNYSRQKYKDKKLIIVENGLGIDATKNISLPKNTIILRSENGPSQALNVGISFLRLNAKPNDWFCKCDSDDYYGPEYLNQIYIAKKSGADYAGRESLYIKTMAGNLWYVEGKNEYIFHGPTLAAKVKNGLDFPVVKDWGEDFMWCKLMHQAGKIPFIIKPEGFCYQRWVGSNHSWPCTDLEIRTSWTATFIDLGIYNINIVNGYVSKPSGIILETPNVNFDNFMPFRILKERSINIVGI